MRRRREERGKEETGGQVARTGTEADERKQKEREKARKRKQKGSTGGTAVGAKPGGAKRNKQKAEYEEPGKKTRETRSERTGKASEAKAERAAPKKPM